MTKLNSQKMALLHQKILEFAAPRGWNPSAQGLAKSVVIEAAELLEHFQWDNTETAEGKDTKEIGYEMADVLWYIFELADKLNIDIADALEAKYKHNDEKYPAEKFTGEHDPDFYYAQKKKYREEKKLQKLQE